MARFGMEPGDRGKVESRTTSRGLIQWFFIPKDSPDPGSQAASHLAAGVRILDASPSRGQLRIYPTDTRPGSSGFLGSKYSKITTILLHAHVDPDWDIADILEELPAGLTKDYEYGLGFAQECDVLIDLVEDNTDCSVIELVASGDPNVAGETFRISFARFDSLRAELARIKNRGDAGIRRVKETHVHNDLAEVFGLQHKALSLGRLPISKWMTKVAAGEVPLNDEEQEVLLSATSASAPAIAASAPDKLARLQRDIEVVGLDQLIKTFNGALDAWYNEDWWQRFFEENVFALQLLFGGPTVFIDSQMPIGAGGNSAKGRKIADYLFKNAMTNNASLVEIKKPSTKLMKRRRYREGVYGVQSEISEAVTQVLDQALQLTRHELGTKQRTGDESWVSNAPRCFVVAGRASELDTADKQKSFDLYREHLSGVRVVTYDEILGQLETLRDFLAADASGAAGDIS